MTVQKGLLTKALNSVKASKDNFCLALEGSSVLTIKRKAEHLVDRMHMTSWWSTVMNSMRHSCYHHGSFELYNFLFLKELGGSLRPILLFSFKFKLNKD